MRINKYLIVSKKGYRASARITNGKPTLQPDEISIYLTLDIPDSLFQRPALKAEIKIDPKTAPSQISAEVIDNIQKVVSENLNLQIQITSITQ